MFNKKQTLNATPSMPNLNNEMKIFDWKNENN